MPPCLPATSSVLTLSNPLCLSGVIRRRFFESYLSLSPRNQPPSSSPSIPHKLAFHETSCLFCSSSTLRLAFCASLKGRRIAAARCYGGGVWQERGGGKSVFFYPLFLFARPSPPFVEHANLYAP